MTFPDDFYWGAATASYQVEGGNDNTDWAQAAREGKVPPAGRLADHYHRFEQDFDLAKELGHNAHRFSVEWARIEPEEGKFNERELEHYKAVLRALHARGMEPFVNLWHFTLPLWFSESGGFEREDAPEIFARYCTKVVEAFGDLAIHYATINEPNVYATHGYLYGAWPPFKRARILWMALGKDDGTSIQADVPASFANLLTYFRVERTLVSAHCAAYVAIKRVNKNALVSVVKHVHHFHGHQKQQNIWKAKVMTYLQSLRFLNRIDHCLDEIGINYYRNTGYGEVREYKLTDMGWKMAPSFIYEVIKLLTRYKKPMFVAEAGLADADDSDRAEYIKVQVKAIGRAVAEGADVRGYFHWSLMDNYEWALGTEKRFGLIEIDYNTLKRTIRPSAYVYKEIIEQGGVVE